MPRLGAEMRHIDDGGRVIGGHAQDLARGQRAKALARLQYRQRAQQAAGIKFGVICHGGNLGGMFHFVHQDVTQQGVTLRDCWSRNVVMLDTGLIFDAGLLPAMIVALAAGVLSFLSPCVLPVVPPYLAYMGGVSVTDMEKASTARRRVFIAALFFVMGLSTVFLLLGIAFSTMGRMLIGVQEYFVIGAGLVVMVLGAHFVGVFRIGFLDREMRLDAGDKGGSAFGAYLLGLAFAFGWTPCLGPVLGAILSLAASEADVGRGTVLLGAYAVGLGIPFLLVAAFFPRLKGVMGWMKRHMRQIEATSGLLLWTVGLMMLTGQFAAFSFWLLERFPFLASVG
jgi:cytochrome c-type biogenesis protein